MTKTIKVELELTDAEMRRLLSISLERVINNAIYVGSAAEDDPVEEVSERASTLWQDCEELKPLLMRLWDGAANNLRNQLYKERS